MKEKLIRMKKNQILWDLDLIIRLKYLARNPDLVIGESNEKKNHQLVDAACHIRRLEYLKLQARQIYKHAKETRKKMVEYEGNDNILYETTYFQAPDVNRTRYSVVIDLRYELSSQDDVPLIY